MFDTADCESRCIDSGQIDTLDVAIWEHLSSPPSFAMRFREGAPLLLNPTASCEKPSRVSHPQFHDVSSIFISDYPPDGRASVVRSVTPGSVT